MNRCIEYVDYLASTQDALVSGRQQVGVPLPKHGSAAGMKPVYTETDLNAQIAAFRAEYEAEHGSASPARRDPHLRAR